MSEGNPFRIASMRQFTQSVVKFLKTAGMLGLRDDFGGMVDGGIAAETIQAFRHVERILQACDASIADIVKVSVYLPDLAEWDGMNRAYLEVFGPHTPARIAVGCAELLFGARVEFDCVAYRLAANSA